MSDNAWRRKGYYRTRVLIGTNDVLESPFPDALVCLTGQQLAMMRNLCEYLHRRSTFASVYYDTYYLAPTNEEWDELEAITAELEGTLMGCEEFVQLLEDIKAATQCACDKLTAMPSESWPAGGIHDGQPDYDDYESNVERGTGDPPGALPTWDDWDDYKCKAAQIVCDDVSGLAAKLEAVYTGGAAVTFAIFQYAIIGSALNPPVALAVAIVGVLIISGTALAMIALQGWIATYKFDLVCAIYSGDTLQDAKAALQEIVSSHWNLALSEPFFWHLFSNKVLSDIFDVTLPTYAEREAGYSAGYCAGCPGAGGARLDAYDFGGDDWESPDWTLEGGATWGHDPLETYCQGEYFLQTPKDARVAWTVREVPGQVVLDLKFTAYALGDGGDESRVLTYGGPSATGPWTPLHSIYLPNFPDFDCDTRTNTWEDIDLSTYTHLKYQLYGVGVADPCNWVTASWEWMVPA